ncbi:ATP-binding protein, partial [bacterium]|nr:ATP-binding protein [bacterium]
FADPDMVELIIRNLLSNALKFSTEQGEIRINCKTLGNFIEISISDDGTGIEEEDLHKIFRIDIKHSRPGTYDEKGTGLGLILCKEFIKQNRGEIWVESKIDIGSVFKFTLLMPA